jgi:hypothetical protein
MGTIATAILAFYTAHANPGGSVYSFEALADCGQDPKAAACTLKPVCESPSPLCAAPRWSAVRGAWVRVESKDAALERYKGIAESLERVAGRMVDCKLPDGSVDFDCVPAGWPRGPGRAQQLAFAAATVALWESGLREDIEIGAPPAGRGPAKEACLLQIMPAQVQALAYWLPAKERTRALKPAEHEELAKTLLGREPEALDRCMEAGMRVLARARATCSGKGMAWDYGMFSAYGQGSKCTSAGNSLGDFAAKRSKTFAAMTASVQKPLTKFEPLRAARIPNVGEVRSQR